MIFSIKLLERCSFNSSDIFLVFRGGYSLQSAKVGIISELAKCEGESGGEK